MAERDWTPRLSNDGRFYCSPACGGGRYCRREWHDYATKAAAALAEKMGPGWLPVVWENMGWHYKVERGAAAIYAHEDRRSPFDPVTGYAVRSYGAHIDVDAYVGNRAGSCGGTRVQFIAHAETPEDALGFATQDARTTENRISQALAELSAEVGA